MKFPSENQDNMFNYKKSYAKAIVLNLKCLPKQEKWKKFKCEAQMFKHWLLHNKHRWHWQKTKASPRTNYLGWVFSSKNKEHKGLNGKTDVIIYKIIRQFQQFLFYTPTKI